MMKVQEEKAGKNKQPGQQSGETHKALLQETQKGQKALLLQPEERKKKNISRKQRNGK